MSRKHKLLGISGSLRNGATNRKLLVEAARLYGPAGYATADLRLPLYDGDDENRAGIPTTVQLLADQISKSDAIIISTPEYNSALSGVLKNALDWVSRTDGKPWLGKPVAIMAAAAGRAGGARALSSLRLAMAPFRARVVPGPEILIAASRKAFDEQGHLIDERAVRNVQALMDALRAEVR